MADKPKDMRLTIRVALLEDQIAIVKAASALGLTPADFVRSKAIIAAREWVASRDAK